MASEKVGLYLRVSREDGDRGHESQSILNQRILLTQYCAQNEYTIADIYIDDGYSGTNFERPAFQRLISDIEAGKINTVLVKDHSRLGRNYIETGRYLEYYFPLHKVRYIAIGDGLDTGANMFSENIAPFLGLMNDIYAKDISHKVRAALTAKKRAGQFIGAMPPFGYTRDATEKGRLVIDEPAAEIIRMLFRIYIESGSVSGTAKQLTELQAPTPSAYRGLAHTQARNPGVWSDQMVRRILTNPTYAGNLTQNRVKKINYKLKQRLCLPKDEWIIVNDTHEGIISQAEFTRVQEILSYRAYAGDRSTAPHLLTGLAYCADCGAPMTYVRESLTRTYMVCQSYRKGGRLGLCTAHSIREDCVLLALQSALCQLALHGADREALAQSIKQPDEKEQLKRNLDAAMRKLALQYDVLHQIYVEKQAGKLDSSTYEQLKSRAERECAMLKKQAQNHQARLETQSPQVDPLHEIDQLLRFETLSRTMILCFIKKIRIHQDKTIEIVFCFRKPT